MRHLHPVQVHKHTTAFGGPGATYTVTLAHACDAASRIVVVAGGGAQTTIRFTNSGGTQLTRRTQALSSIDMSIHDAVAAGGETALHVTLNGDENVVLAIYHTDLGAYIGGSSGVMGADTATDLHSRPDTAVTVSGAAVLFGGWGVFTSTPYSEVVRWRQMGPLGHLYSNEGHQPGAGGTPVIIASGVADIGPGKAFPVSGTAGQYRASSVWVGGGDTLHAVQAAYADATGIPSHPAPANAIVGENSLPGTHRANWFAPTDATSSTIAGYVKATSYEAGDTAEFAVDSSGSPWRAEVYRLGWYGWEPYGARLATGHIAGSIVAQDAPTVDPVLGSTHCAWDTNATWDIPSDATPGVYYVLFRRTDDLGQFASSHFTVRGPVAGRAAVVMPDCTYQAYNLWGATGDSGARYTPGVWSGRSLYANGATQSNLNSERAYAVSFDRPYSCQSTQANTYLFDADQPWIAWAEAQGMNLTYLSDVDLDKDPTALTGAGQVVMLGHHEYWTANQWSAFKAAVDAGVNMLANGSNIALWRVRFAPADTLRRTVICYKESLTRDEGPGWTGTGYDPGGYTGTWRDAGTVDGAPNPDPRRENSLTGQMFILSAPVSERFIVPYASKAMPCWRNNAAVQALTTGQTWNAPAQTIGDEVDAADDSAGQPLNLVRLNPTPISGTNGANAAGTIYTTPINFDAGWTLYRAASGALVAMTGSWRAGQGLSRWAQSSYNSAVTAPSADWASSWLALCHDLGITAATPRALSPGLDTAPVAPTVGEPGPNRNLVALAYGLDLPPSGGMLLYFLGAR